MTDLKKLTDNARTLFMQQKRASNSSRLDNDEGKQELYSLIYDFQEFTRKVYYCHAHDDEFSIKQAVYLLLTAVDCFKDTSMKNLWHFWIGCRLLQRCKYEEFMELLD